MAYVIDLSNHRELNKFDEYYKDRKIIVYYKGYASSSYRFNSNSIIDANERIRDFLDEHNVSERSIYKHVIDLNSMVKVIIEVINDNCLPLVIISECMKNPKCLDLPVIPTNSKPSAADDFFIND